MATAAPPAPPDDPLALKADSYWSRLAIHRVPQRYILWAAFVSYLVVAVSYLQDVPVQWAFFLGFIPWVFIVFFEIEWSYKHFGWFAIFAAMAFVQLVHYSEHCIEVIQVHIFGDPVSQATAVFTKINTEGVHFAGDTFLTVGTLVLITKFPRNPWLWIAVPFQIFHQAEHTFLMFNYVFEGARQGGPGLLASPHGAIDVPWYNMGGAGLNRPDLHWIYNTLYTVPFSLALVWQLKRTYDESLAVAFPQASRKELVEVARRLETLKYPAHTTVLAEGDPAERLFVVTEGEVSVIQQDENGRSVEVATLHKGQYFGEIGLLVPGGKHTATVRAKTDVTVLCMDEETFRHLLSVSQNTKAGLDDVVKTRLQTIGAHTVAADS